MTETKSKLFTALVAAQQEMRDPFKDAQNPHFRSRFVSLKGVLDAVRPALHKHGLVLVQLLHTADSDMVGCAAVETMLAHESGESISSFCPIICAKANDPQAFGSAVTYARRYGAAAICGVAPSDEDDDGNLDRNAQPPPASDPAKPATAPKPAATKVQPFDLAEEAIAAIDSVGNLKALKIVGQRIAVSKFSGDDLKKVRDAWGERKAIMEEPVS